MFDERLLHGHACFPPPARAGKSAHDLTVGSRPPLDPKATLPTPPPEPRGHSSGAACAKMPDASAAFGLSRQFLGRSSDKLVIIQRLVNQLPDLLYRVL